MLSPYVTIEIVEMSEWPLTFITNKLPFVARIVRLQMRFQFVTIKKSSVASFMAALVWLVIGMSKKMHVYLIAVWEEFFAVATFVCGILFMMTSMLNHVANESRKIGTDHANELFIAFLLMYILHVLHHVVVLNESFRAHATFIFVVHRSWQKGFFQSVANDCMALICTFGMEFSIAVLAHEEISIPVLLQSSFKLSVVDHHVTTYLELTDECLVANGTKVIFLDILFWTI